MLLSILTTMIVTMKGQGEPNKRLVQGIDVEAFPTNRIPVSSSIDNHPQFILKKDRCNWKWTGSASASRTQAADTPFPLRQPKITLNFLFELPKPL